MTLRQFFIRFSGILLSLQVVCVIVTTAAVMLADRNNASSVAREELQRVFREHEQELAGNLMLGHKCLIEHQLNRIADREGMRVGLQSALYVRETPDGNRHQARSDFPVVFAEEPYGTLTLTKALDSHRSLGYLEIALGTGQLAIFAAGMFALYLWARGFLLRPLENLATFRAGNQHPHPLPFARWLPRELEQIGTALTELWQQREERSNELAIVKMSRQVAHDIRSPITALQVVVQESQSMPEDRRMLLEGAANRIRDIADNLLNLRVKAVDHPPHQSENLTYVVWPLWSPLWLRSAANTEDTDASRCAVRLQRPGCLPA